MKYLYFIILLSISSCSSNAQQENNGTHSKGKSKKETVIENGMLKSFHGIDLSRYELNVEDFDVEMVTINHLLCLSTDECDLGLTQLLIERGANVNFKCEELDALITNVAFCKDNGLELTKLLLESGANINGADQDNDSFLSYAISRDNIRLVEYLIQNGANKMQRDINQNMGCLPIHGCESIQMLELLISNDFEIDVQCDNGRNLLHFAAKANLKEIAEYLVARKLVDINQKDKNGETAFDYAVKYKNLEIQKIIKK